MRKKNSLLMISVIISGLFVSCWDNFTERTYYNANITSFGFDAHDTCPDIEDYVFNINQLSDTGLIYNLDSLPYGRVVNTLYPTLTLQSSNGNIFVNDSLWEDNDSIDFTAPVIFKNTSADGLYTRIYKISVNVHQVEPDSMVMNKISNVFPANVAKSKMIRLVDGGFLSFSALSAGGMSAALSTNGALTWSAQTVTGITEEVDINSLCVFDSKYFVTSKSNQLYTSTNGFSWKTTGDGTKIVTLYGSVKKKYIDESSSFYLTGLAKKASGELCFARSADGVAWTLGSAVNADFPVSDYALVKGTTVTGVQFYTIATGFNAAGGYSSSIWSTETGLNWVLISDGSDARKALGKRKGASIFYYDNYLVCFGGIDPDGYYHKDLYVSEDHGKAWAEAPEKWAFLNMTAGLAYTDVYVEHQEDAVNDKDREFIWIFGGSKDTGLSSAVWKGHLNKMVFLRR